MEMRDIIISQICLTDEKEVNKINFSFLREKLMESNFNTYT